MMNKIKNIFKSKVTLAILACLLLVGVFAGIATMAGETTPTLTIVDKTINHAESARIIYRVRIDNTTQEDWILNPGTMKFWANEPAEASVAADYTAKGTYKSTDGNAIIVEFESYAIAPVAMTNSIYCQAEFGDEYTAIERYSVFQYFCEMELDGATNEQLELYAAMKDYIDYAQAYLGITEFPKANELAYVKLENCWIELGGAKITDASLPKGDYELHTEYASVKVEDQNGHVGDLREDGKWYANLIDNNTLSYTAFEATLMNVTIPAGTELVNVATSTVDGAPAYTVLEAYAEGAHEIWAKPADTFFAVPTNVVDKVFSGWQLSGADTLTTTDVMYPVTAETGEIPTPVFKTDDEVAAAQTDSTLTTWVNEWSRISQPVNTDTGKNNSYNAKDLASNAAPERMYFNMNYKLESTNSGVDYSAPKVSDFFKNDGGSSDHTQFFINLGGDDQTTSTNHILGFAFVASNAVSLDDTIENGYYIHLRESYSKTENSIRFNQDNGRCFMTYGEYHNIQFLIDFSNDGNGNITVEGMSLFIDGNFVGYATVRLVDTFRYTNNYMCGKHVLVNRTYNTKIYIKGFLVKEFKA